MITTIHLTSLRDDDIRQADTIRAVDPYRPRFFRLIHSPAMRSRRGESGRRAQARHQLDVRIDSGEGEAERLRLMVATVYPDATFLPDAD
jgi:hypothetical protein